MKWEKVDGPQSGNGEYTDRLAVPGGWIYKVEEWATGGMEPRLINRVAVFVPKPPRAKRDRAQDARPVRTFQRREPAEAKATDF